MDSIRFYNYAEEVIHKDELLLLSERFINELYVDLFGSFFDENISSFFQCSIRFDALWNSTLYETAFFDPCKSKFFVFLTSSTLSKIFRYCLQSIRRGLHATDSSCYSKLSNTNRYFTESKQYLLDLFFFYYYFDSIPCSRRIEMGLSSTIFPCRSCLGNFEQRYHIFRSFFSSINFVFQSYETFTTRNQSKSWILSPMTRSTFDHRWSTSNTMSFLWPVSAKEQLLMWEKSKQKWLNPMFCLNRLRSKLNIEWI